MWKVNWSTSEMSGIYTRWFHGEESARRFAATRKIAVIYDPDGKRV